MSHRFIMGLSGSLQRAVLGLVPGQDVLTAATVLPQLGHLLTQRCVLPLQEGGAHRDLVLLQATSVTRTLRCHVVLLPPGPVLLILRDRERKWDESTLNRISIKHLCDEIFPLSDL